MKLSPMTVVQKTPRTNCGKCGYPTCISFATALTRRKVYYTKCPYFKADEKFIKLIDQLFVSNEKEKKPGISAVSLLEKRLKFKDFSKIAKPLGCEYKKESNKEIIVLKYLRYNVVVEKSKDEINVISDKKNFDVWDKILILNYLYFSGSSGIAGEWIAMESMPNSISKIKALKRDCEDPLKEYFKGKKDLLKKRAESLPSKFIEKPECQSDVCVIIYVLPMVPIRINFWDEILEDGFDASVKILFDKNALDYLDLEALVFASEKVVSELTGGIDAT